MIINGELVINTPRWALPLLPPKRYKGAKGGRGSGKSNFFAELIVELMVHNADMCVVAIREIQKSLKFSAKKLIEDKINTLMVSHLFDITQNEIRRVGGSGIVIFMGMQDHTADSIKSLEGFDVAWVEEAQSISQRSMELLLPTIRKQGSEILFSWNPTNESDPIEEFFKHESDDKVLVHINAEDNPFLPNTLRDEMERHKRESPQTFDHVWLGDFIQHGEIFTYEMFKHREAPDDLWVFIAVDIAFAQTKTADNSAIATIGLDEHNNFYLLEIKAGKWTSSELTDHIVDTLYEYDEKIIALGVEKTTASWHYCESLKETLDARMIPVYFEELKPSGRAKESRIQSYLLSTISRGRFFVSCECEDFKKEAINFPSEKFHDDMIDAVSYAIEMGFNRKREGKVSYLNEGVIHHARW